MEAVGYLLQQGHRRIGLLGIREGFTNYERRVDAFYDAFKQAEAPLERQLHSGTELLPCELRMRDSVAPV